MPRHGKADGKGRHQPAAAASAVDAAAAAPPSPSGEPNSPVPVAVIVAGIVVVVAALLALIYFFVKRQQRPSYEELSLVRSADGDEPGANGHTEEEAAAAAPVPGEASEAAVAAEEDGRRSHEEAPPPPPPPIEYSPFELPRQPEDGADARAAKHCWQAPRPHEFEVRAAGYLRDGTKAASEDGSVLLAVELFRTRGAPQLHTASRSDSPVHTLSRRTSAALSSALVVNLIVPSADGHFQVVLYFGLLAESAAAESPASRLYERFCAGSDAFRNARFKLIPTVTDGPFHVKQGVGSRPAILGKTLRQRFFRGGGGGGAAGGYFEVDVDCNSSPAAGRIVSLVKSSASALVVDLAFVLEAQATEELPERVLGCARMVYVDLSEEIVPLCEGAQP